MKKHPAMIRDDKRNDGFHDGGGNDVDVDVDNHSKRSSLDGSESAYCPSKDSDMESMLNGYDESNQHGAAAADKETVIGKQETRHVFMLRMVVLVVLVASSIVVAASVYLYLSYIEQNQFEQQFQDDSQKVLDAIGKSIDQTLASFDSVAVTLVSTAKMTNQTWPFVTIDDYAVRMSKLLPLSHSLTIGAYHLVKPEQRLQWEDYAATHDDWVLEHMRVQETWGGYHGLMEYNGTQNAIVHGDYGDIPYNESRDMMVNWQTFPTTSSYTYSWDVYSAGHPESYVRTMEKHVAVIGEPYMLAAEPAFQEVEAIWADFFRSFLGPDENAIEPLSDWTYPIIDTVDNVRVAGAVDYDPAKHVSVGALTGFIYWRDFVRDILPSGSNGIRIVFANPCSVASFTYQINGPDVVYLGAGDKHEKRYDQHFKKVMLHELSHYTNKSKILYTGAPLDSVYCPLTLHVYPSEEMRAIFTSWNPIILTGAVLAIFSFVSLVFYLYDYKVERRQTTVLNTAVRSTAIVSSLFPSEVRDRLYPATAAADDAKQKSSRRSSSVLPDTAKGKLKSFLRETGVSTNPSLDSSTSVMLEGAPIAELYPDTTVLFADISGFTAWSSERHPAQVFHLLESVYAAFDALARKRGVFKVETIGDCYVAVVGLPAPRKNHAVVMARFARDCRDRMITLVEELSSTLGPGTTDLCMRFGLNSGPTTAGVLRGEKSRFQLFGDTVNTAARMESNGQRNKIQVSQKTADLIRLAGKEHWLTQRDEKVECKGKGKLTTFWCEPNSASPGGGSVFSASEMSEGVKSATVDAAAVANVGESYDSKIQRLVDWNVSMFSQLLGDVIEHRTQSTESSSISNEHYQIANQDLIVGHPIDGVQEEIPLLEASSTTSVIKSSTASIALSDEVTIQLHTYIALIAEGYQANPFHNFAHCSHVVMSTKKLLDRITEREKEVQRERKRLDNRTHGITSNPLTKLAIVFAALIHDMDHSGVSNAQLVAENDPVALTYNGQSVAEQNSVDVAWAILMRPEFASLRVAIYSTDSEFKLFRQIVVNAVMATDLFDKNLKAMREARWEKSFELYAPDSTDNGSLANPSFSTDIHASNRRATIVIELIIQASDVSHTMQHFTVYKKWNMRLLAEMYHAYQSGRMAKNPLDGWYDGELWFFDNYVIPLAQKLRECQVFGVSCDEFLDYAKDNRSEWEIKGREIVEEAKERLQESILTPRKVSV